MSYLYIRVFESALKSFLLNIAFLSLTFLRFESRIHKVFYVIFYIFVLNNYKWKISKLSINHKILIEYSNFFLSFSQFH